MIVSDNSLAIKTNELLMTGITVLDNIFSQDKIFDIRSQILQQRHLLKNTKPGEPSLHLAGFHQFPELESIHSDIMNSIKIIDFLKYVTKSQVKFIGNSDITINRSQHWHKDLLRGKFAEHHNSNSIWGKEIAGVYRVILYLQPSSSLKVIPGSHLEPTSLASDEYCIPHDETSVQRVNVDIGDIAVMDVRTTHRGLSSEYIIKNCEYFKKNPSIMVATILGDVSAELTHELEVGNFMRQLDWVIRNKHRTYELFVDENYDFEL